MGDMDKEVAEAWPGHFENEIELGGWLSTMNFTDKHPEFAQRIASLIREVKFEG